MYKLTTYGMILRTTDGVLIPDNAAGNKDYDEYARWLKKGNVPTPADPQSPQPGPAVTMRQAQLALLANGLLDAVDQAIAAAPRAVQIAWQTAAQVERDSPLIDALGAQLGLSPQQIDALFAEASTL